MSNVLVTGTNSGFGRLIAVSLAQRGHVVFATMRDPASKNRAAAEELVETAHRQDQSVRVLDLDVTSDASVNAAIAAAVEQAGHLDAVVNNAGYTVADLMETVASEQLLDELNTNVVGMHRVARAVLPTMRARRAGLIVYMSSTLGRLVLPALGTYVASKWAVEAMAETLRYELQPTGVEVSIVQPGPFPTNLYHKRQLGTDRDRARDYGTMTNALELLTAGLQQLFASPGAPDPQEVAEVVVQLVEASPGTRAERVVVDRLTGDGARALNDAHAQIQRLVLAGMGLTNVEPT